jgi:hypothetical protein
MRLNFGDDGRPALREKKRSFYFLLAGEEICQRDAQRLGDPAQAQDGSISFPTLDGTDKGAV